MIDRAKVEEVTRRVFKLDGEPTAQKKYPTTRPPKRSILDELRKRRRLLKNG